MPISTSTTSFTNIQTELGGTNPISLSEYYNASGKFGFGITGIPTSGQLSVNNFRGKSKPVNVSISITGTYNTASDNSNFRYILFSSNGSFTIDKNLICDILIIGGGGGGGINMGSGGGAGGVVYITNYSLNSGTYSISIGNGGLPMQSGADASTANGGNSIIRDSINNDIITALGGAIGSSQSSTFNGIAPKSGGSGAGGTRNGITGGSGIQNTSGTISAISRTNGYGNAGGNGTNTAPWPCGGGGGAGGIGGNGSGTIAGNGGIGIQINITGTNTYYAGGGGGGAYKDGTYNSTSAGTGGLGGGGNGSLGSVSAISGLANTGGGGGGAGGGGGGGTGGSGVFILRYSIFNIYTSISGSGNTINTPSDNSNYRYAFFANNGTFSINKDITCDILIIGGGGGGGFNNGWEGGGGGGAGGVGIGTINFKSGINYNITIGSGGKGGLTAYTNGENGINSSIIGDIIDEKAYGGGGGSYYTGLDGGSGGGASGASQNYSAGNATKGLSSSGANANIIYYGNKGGDGINPGGGGGGGGAGAAGNPTGGSWNFEGANGGNGIQSSITGILTYYGGGGGGARGIYGTNKGNGGLGGGGNGAGNNTIATAGINNTGGGGGGTGNLDSSSGGASGGSGLVIIRYAIN